MNKMKPNARGAFETIRDWMRDGLGAILFAALTTGAFFVLAFCPPEQLSGEADWQTQIEQN